LLAFVFWHRPAPAVTASDYEGHLSDFHRSLRDQPVRGLVGSQTYGCDRLPFAEQPGYEDWYLLEDFAALGTLNDAAIDPRHRPAHDSVAGLAENGTGGIYRIHDASPTTNVAGALLGADTATWFPKPPGTTYEQLQDHVRTVTDGATAAEPTLWRRQLTLGPAPEFCLRSRGPLEVPAPLEATVVRLRPLGSGA